MRLKVFNVTMIALVMALGVYITIKEREKIQMPFRCQGVTEYNLGEDDDEVKFSVNQNLRLEENARSIFLVKGNVYHGKEKYILNRSFELSSASAIDKDTVMLKIDKITASATDNTPDALFSVYFDEMALEPDSLQFDIVYLEKKAWLIGNPMQFFFTCARY